MNILLINPPNSGRSIPEERYGMDSLKQIFRGEPLALETLAGNLVDHDVRILDLKADPDGLSRTLSGFTPDITGITGVTCEANTVLSLAETVRDATGSMVAAGGIHASCDPEFFNRREIDYVAVGMGKASFRELVTAVEAGKTNVADIPGIARTTPGKPLSYVSRDFTVADLVDGMAPRYDLVAEHRDSYRLGSLNLTVGFVTSAAGCPFSCSFCCIKSLTGGRYLNHEIDGVIRDIRLLGDIPVIRLIDANTFGNPRKAAALAHRIIDEGIEKNFIADVRSDTVVEHPELIALWKRAGLRSVIIGFEEISDKRLDLINKSNKVHVNTEAIRILKEMGITIVGDFIVSPDYEPAEFERLARYLDDNPVDLPIVTVLTPLPGTPLHGKMKEEILIDDLDYYTLTNAVLPTRLEEKAFYNAYADLMISAHAKARL